MDQTPSKMIPAAQHCLSERQIQSLLLVAKGMTSKEIGRELGISPSTVDNHISAAIDRLGARNRVDAARMIVPSIADCKTDHWMLAPIMEKDETADFAWWMPPPLGGRPNTLTTGQRAYRILQVALLSVMGVAAGILTIAGVVHILSK